MYFEGTYSLVCNKYAVFYLWLRESQKFNVCCFSCKLIFLHCKISLAVFRSEVSKLCLNVVTTCLTFSTPLFIEGNILVLFYDCWNTKQFQETQVFISKTIHLISSMEGLKFNLCIFCQNIKFITAISFLLNCDTGI